jgi:hypothetical protein
MKAFEAIERGEEPEPSFRNLSCQSISERQATGDWFAAARSSRPPAKRPGMNDNCSSCSWSCPRRQATKT